MMSESDKVDALNQITTAETLRLVRAATSLSEQTGAVLAVEIMAQAALGAAIALVRSAAANGVGDFHDAGLRAAFDRLMTIETRVMERKPDGTFSSPQPIN